MSRLSTQHRNDTTVVFDINDRPTLREAVPLGLQHVVAMLLGNITGPIIVAGALGLAFGERAFLLQVAFLMAGVATVVQAFPIGPIGGRIPIIMGTSIAFVAALTSVGREFGLAAVFGACLVASVVEIVLGFGIVRLRPFFPPLVNGIVVMLIGLTLIPVGVDYAAGGVGSADYGSPVNLTIAAVVFALTLLLNQFGRGFWSYGSVLIGTAVGYAMAMSVGYVDLTPLSDAAWLSVPAPLEFGLAFPWRAILLVAFVYVVSAMETLGDIAGTMAAVGREPTDAELRGGLVADGVMSGVAALFSALPNTSYSQNVGLVNFTGVVSRYVTAVAGVVLIVLGVVPKVGAFFATIPPPVIGGGGLIMFSMIVASGVKIIHTGTRLTHRNMVILAVAIGLGLGVELRPDAVGALPQTLRTLFGSGLILGGMTGLVLNAWFHHGRRAR